MDEYTDFKTKKEVQASKHTTIERLPKFFIFHLKRFAYAEATQKIAKYIDFPKELNIPSNYLSRSNSNESRQYELYATISHIGDNTTNGHYICDIKMGNGSWFHFDDSKVIPTQLDYVLASNAYLLIYEQM